MVDQAALEVLQALRDASPTLEDEWMRPGAALASKRVKLDDSGCDVQEL